MVKLNKNQIKSVVRDWVEARPLQHYKREQKKLIDGLENYINDLVEVNNQIYKIEEKAFNHVSESENESESESENDSDSKSKSKLESESNVENETFRYFGPPHLKPKPGDTFNGIKYIGPYNKNTSIYYGEERLGKRKTQ